jgi:DNA-binding LytR/AlgR family response regulator
MIRAFLVDDDPDSIQTLRLCLADFKKNIEIVGTSTNPSKAISEIKKVKPDVLFLDIDMPIINGLSLAKETIGHYGELIFVTAHEKFWKDAFNMHAFQFLLKPINNGKLASVINDLVEREKNGWLGLWQQRIEEMEEFNKEGKAHFDYVWLEGDQNGLDKVFWKDIVLIERHIILKSEVVIYTKNRIKYSKKNTNLSHIEMDILRVQKGIKEKFWRINPQQIFNIEFAGSFNPNNKILVLDESVGKLQIQYPLSVTKSEILTRIEKNKLRSRP